MDVKTRRFVPPMYRKALHVSKPALAWALTPACLLMFACLILMRDTVQRSTPAMKEAHQSQLAADAYTAPPRRHLHRALYQQGVAHDEFHTRGIKERLAELVRHHNRVAIVGMEGGHDVIHLALAGYEVHAFEPMKRYINGVKAWARGEHITGITIHHCAAGNATGGTIIAQYNTAEVNDREKVPRKRVDDVLDVGLDVLSVDIQGGEWDVVQGAKRIIEGPGIRMLWIEIQPCNPRLPPMLEALDNWGYAVFDMAGYGGMKVDVGRVNALRTEMAIGMGWHRRPSQFGHYVKWFCGMRNKWSWLQSDLLAIKRELLTPQMMLRLNTLGVDVLNDYKRKLKT